MLLKQIERSKNFSEATARRMVWQLLIAVEFMHGKGIVHRDLKPANLLLSETNIDATIKICDFGFARLVGEESSITGRTGTLRFMAPEVLSHNTAYGKPCDMWSLGVIFYVMLCGTPPFHSQKGGSPDERGAVTQQILAGNVAFTHPVWDSVSSGCKQFLRLLLTVDPVERITASEGLAHPWVRDDSSPHLSLCALRDINEEGMGLRAVGLAVMAAHRLLYFVRRKGAGSALSCIETTLSHLLQRRMRVRRVASAGDATAVAEILRSDAAFGKIVLSFSAAGSGIDDISAPLLLDGLVGHECVQRVDLSDNPLTHESERSLIRLVAGTAGLQMLSLKGTEMEASVVQRVVQRVGMGGGVARTASPVNDVLLPRALSLQEARVSSVRSGKRERGLGAPKKPAVPTIATLKKESKQKTVFPLSPARGEREKGGGGGGGGSGGGGVSLPSCALLPLKQRVGGRQA